MGNYQKLISKTIQYLLFKLIKIIKKTLRKTFSQET